MELLFVRHGESQGNVEGRIQGHLDSPLTDRGRTQAAAAADWLRSRGTSFDRVYCSPLRRAADTAGVLTERLGAAPAEPVTDLREVHCGDLQGMTRDEIVKRYPDFMQRDITGLGDFAAYGGESYDAVQTRVAKVRGMLEERHRAANQRVLIVAHGGINFQIVKALICLPVPRVGILRMSNCSMTQVVMRDRRGVYLGEVAWHVPLDLLPTVSGAELNTAFA